MGRAIRLARILRRCGTGTESDVYGKLPPTTFFAIAFGVLLGIGLFYVGFRAGDFQALFQMVGGIGTLLGLLVFVSALLIFFLSLGSLLRTLFLSTDIDVLLGLPFTATELALARVLGQAPFAFGISFAAVIPFFIGYGISTGSSLGFWLAAVLGALSTPLLVLCLIAGVLTLLVRFVPPARNKDIISGAMILIPLVLCIGMVFVGNGPMTADAMANILSGLSHVVGVVPTVPFLMDMCEGNNIALNCGVVLLMTAVCVAAAYLIIRLCYLSAVLSMHDTNSRARHFDDAGVAAASRGRTPARAFMLKDLRQLRRTPAYTINCFLLTLLMGPLLIATMAVGGSNMDIFGEMLNFTGDGRALVACGLLSGVACLVTFIMLSNTIGPTVLTREGADFQIMKQIPLPYREQIKGKRDCAMLVCQIGTTFWIAVGMAALVFLCGLPWWLVPVGAAYCFAITWVLVDLQVLEGLRSPNFTWTNEATVTKSSLTGMLLTLVGGIVAGAIPGIVMLLGMMGVLPGAALAADVPFVAVSVAVVVVAAALALVVDRLVLSYGEKRMREL
ncbi:MAG: hypothetical protein Q4E12_08350 [Coriobacteriia bacterium]|nr:hypothetical protein [Coriobacteriia bacterium]